jgi:spore maturation protein CgeB
MYKILCIGPQWRGSNAGGLFKALSRQGHLIEILDEFYEIPLKARHFNAYAVAKAFRKVFIKEYNSKILDISRAIKADIVFIYKGGFVLPGTLHKLKKQGVKLINFFPDVSFHTHGKYLKKSLPIYDIVFTTKSFGVKDMNEQLGIQNSYFIPHGFDPEVHKMIDFSKLNKNPFKNDVSFIGTWSLKKEKLLDYIIEQIPQVNLKIFGSQWEKASEQVQSRWMKREVLGDLYALVINSSKINLGLLSEQVKGASSGDQITSRTFHIPASGGFLLHERTDEVTNYYIEDKEITCFGNKEELISKIRYYLEHEPERMKIKMEGHKRALKDHSLDNRAKVLLKVIEGIEN